MLLSGHISNDDKEDCDVYTCAYCGQAMKRPDIDDHLQFYHSIKLSGGTALDWTLPHSKSHVFFLRIKVRDLSWQ